MPFDKRSLTFALLLLMIAIEVIIQVGNYASSTAFETQIFMQFGLHGAYILQALDGTRTFIAHSPIYSYVTYALLHAGWLHLVMNMLVFAQLGPPCERAMGWQRYALFSLLTAIICGAGGLWVSSLWRDIPNLVLVGYSGVIFGYMGMVVRMVIVGAKDKKAAAIDLARRNVLLIGFIALPFVFPSIPISGEAHIIGLVLGFIVAPYFLRNAPRLTL